MIICGLKLTHDGAVALLDGNRLVFSIEMEKINNNVRYSAVDDLSVVLQLLADFGYQVDDVDEWIIDGWDGDKFGTVKLRNHGVSTELTLAPYRETEQVPDMLQPGFTGKFSLSDGRLRPYSSYVHIAGHLASAYCTSEFAQRGDPCFVLIWDGGLFPRLYWLDPEHGVENGGELFPLIGHSYATAAHHFGPFRRSTDSLTVDDLSVAGKLMAYIALGQPRNAVLRVLRETFDEHFEADTPQVAQYRQLVGGFGSNSEPSMRYVHAYFRAVRLAVAGGVSDEDVLASVHQFLEDLLIERVTAKVLSWKGPGPWNLCFVGGCALNIKWNSALRAHPMFSQVWVPPFPNDSGSAIGAVALGMIRQRGISPIEWHARLGPALTPVSGFPDDWTSMQCSPEEVARLLHESGEPVVVLNGRAEIGPRALGGRSIIAPAVDPAMKDYLNDVKNRASYRPVAPICLVEHASQIFDPGTPDPHMLFDHMIRPEWVDRIPAVRHLDGTARLQTISSEDDPVMTVVLREYHLLSGIPVLCNTSANFGGRGFFPDVASVMEWGRINTIWSDGVLYRRLACASASHQPAYRRGLTS